jgi:hypothetical protein
LKLTPNHLEDSPSFVLLFEHRFDLWTDLWPLPHPPKCGRLPLRSRTRGTPFPSGAQTSSFPPGSRVCVPCCPSSQTGLQLVGCRVLGVKNTPIWSDFGRLDPSYDRVGDGSPAAVARQDDWCRSAIVRELNLDGFGRIQTGIVGIDTGHGEQDVGGFNLGRQLQ